MEISAQHEQRRLPSLPVSGSKRLALWKAAQKQLRGKLNPEEVTKMRQEWDQAPRGRR
jgi:hypothetical protein